MKKGKENEEIRALANVDRLIHEPARLKIIAVLYVLDQADFTFLMAQTGLSWGNLSSHLSKLEEAGYVEVEKSFVRRRPHTMLQLTKKGRSAFQEYRRSMKQVLDGFPD
jgi:DNA-binding MarR family transcriptional regulator